MLTMDRKVIWSNYIALEAVAFAAAFPILSIRKILLASFRQKCYDTLMFIKIKRRKNMNIQEYDLMNCIMEQDYVNQRIEWYE